MSDNHSPLTRPSDAAAPRITPTESTDPMLLDSGTARELVRGARWRRYAVVGDSIAQGVGDPSPGYLPTGWADRVVTALRTAEPELRYLNTGRMGATTAQVVEHQLPRVLEFEPDLVHIICGGNDMFLPEPDLDALRANLDALFAPLASTGAQLCTFTVADVWEIERMAAMAPVRARMAELNAIIRDVAAGYDALLVDFWAHPLRLRPELMSSDLIHFTTSGHAVVATEMIRALSTLIPRTPVAR